MSNVIEDALVFLNFPKRNPRKQNEIKKKEKQKYDVNGYAFGIIGRSSNGNVQYYFI